MQQKLSTEHDSDFKVNLHKVALVLNLPVTEKEQLRVLIFHQ